MPSLVIHDLDSPWPTFGAGLGAVADASTVVSGAASVRLNAVPGALNAFAEVVFLAPLDLSGFDELRFWVLADRAADGGLDKPFFLEISYVDAGDLPGEEHRWFVPVNVAGQWEQRRIGIEHDRRSAITSFRLRCLTDLPFTLNVDELLAVREEMLTDVERALVDRASGPWLIPGASVVPLSQSASAGDLQLVLPLSPAFAAGNRVIVQGGAAGDELHSVVTAVHDTVLAATTLELANDDAVVGALTAGVATVSLRVPVLIDAPPNPLLAATPAIVLTMLEAREDPVRSSSYSQRDSFRLRGALIACSVRPSAQAYRVDYQLNVRAPLRSQQLLVQGTLLSRLRGLESNGFADAFRINGAPAPLMTLPTPPLLAPALGLLSAMFLRINTRMEIAPRVEQRWPRQESVVAAQLDAPFDQESIVLPL